MQTSSRQQQAAAQEDGGEELVFGLADAGADRAHEPEEEDPADRAGLADQAIVPADMAAGGCHDRGSVPEFLVGLADRAAVGDDHLPFEHPAEQVGHVPGLLLAHRPCQLERLSREGDDPGVTVRLEDVMTGQPGLIQDMRPCGSRSPPAWEVALASVRRRLAECLRHAEVVLYSVFESDRATADPVIDIDELNVVRQFARLNGSMRVTLFVVWGHTSIMLTKTSKSRMTRCRS